MVRALCLPCRGTDAVPGQGNKIPPAVQHSQHFLHFFLNGAQHVGLGTFGSWSSHYISLPRFLLYPPPVSQGSGTKDKFLVLLVLGLLTSWAHSAWHHSFGTQAMQGLGGHRTLSSRGCQEPEVPLMLSAAGACAGPSCGGRGPLSPFLSLSLPRQVCLWLACGSFTVLGL